MKLGIEKMTIYAGRAYLDMHELAIARNVSPDYVTKELFCMQRTILPPYEDAVTLAVNAAKKLLEQNVSTKDIELLIVGSESSVDCGKPISTWVHRLCNLPSHCRNFEIKHACYGGTGALKMASYWCACNPGKKALIINSDFTRNCLNQSWEYIGGGVGVAMLVGSEAEVVEFEMEKVGYWTTEIYDTFRPTSILEIMKDEESLFSYLDALDGAFDHYIKAAGDIDFINYFKKNIYHAPFSKMPFIAHKSLLSRWNMNKQQTEDDFNKRVLPSLHFHKNLGSCYGGSTFVSLAGLLHCADDLEVNDRISIFAYGSGCQGEFYSATITENSQQNIRKQNIEDHIAQRQKLSVAQYEDIENIREKSIEAMHYSPDTTGLDDLYSRQYKDQKWLVLKDVKNYERFYDWS